LRICVRGYSLPLLHAVLLVVLPVLQLITWLATHWSVKFKAPFLKSPLYSVLM
jgi:hypothetical protein